MSHSDIETGNFMRRFLRGQARVARLNRAEMGVPSKQLEGPGHEERITRIQAQFRKIGVSRPRRRPLDRTRLGMAIWLTVWATCMGITAATVMTAAGDRPVLDGVRHVAAYPNCDFARAVGAAPADYGQPGYWPQHDRDGDGLACEPIPDWVER